ALLAAVAPCGVLLTHGSPGDQMRSLDDLDAISLRPGENDAYHGELLEDLLCSYGQRGEVTGQLLARLSTQVGELSLVVHGHARDEQGYFTEGGNQVCPVLFGSPDANKRYLVLDLAGRYRRVEDLREGIEIRRLYQPSGVV